jgi:dGTPase
LLPAVFTALYYTNAVSLSSYAMPAEATRGRRHPEVRHPYRSEYQRDRDRVIHTKAFRRLENKTQVFDPAYSDHFRNRLTHTLEVSQISRTISQALGLNTDLCEVLALSHDLGHPPFSHEGERVLNRIMQKYGLGFDHNLHGLRIVEDFEEKYPAFRGLNLTFEVREGIVKHSRDYGPSDSPYLDISEYRLGERPPLEAQLIDLADEIAYNTADLDDGYESGLLTLEQMEGSVGVFGDLHREVTRTFPRASEKLTVAETVRRLIDRLASSLIRHSRKQLQENGIDSVEKVRKWPRRLIGFEPETAVQNAQLKAFLRSDLYNHDALRRGREKVQGLVEELFRHYLQHPETLPLKHYSRVSGQQLHRVVCDYIAGMTDNFAHLKHAEIPRVSGPLSKTSTC